MNSVTTTDLKSIGLGFERWQDAVEAAITTNRLQVTGQVRGGQLIQYTDGSGAQINILAVEPFATFAGFASVTQTFAHVEMITDVVALCQIVDEGGTPLATVTLNLAQGPLIVDAGQQRFQPMAVSALAIDVTAYPSSVVFENTTGEMPGALTSHGAEIIDSGSGAATPDASAYFSASVLESEFRTSELSGDRFIHATVDGPFPFDVCLPADLLGDELPARGSILAGEVMLVGSVLLPVGGGCGCGGGSCGCGGH